MTPRKKIKPGDKIGLKLTAEERLVLLDELNCLPSELERIIRRTPAAKPVLLTLDNLDELDGYVAAEANHAKDKKLQKQLDNIFEKIQKLLDSHTDEEPLKTLKIEDAAISKLFADQAAAIAEYAAKALMAAEQIRIKTKPVKGFSLEEGERAVLAVLPTLSTKVKKKLSKPDPDLTMAEVAGITMAVAESFVDVEGMKKVALLLVAKKLMDCLRNNTVFPDEPAGKKRPKSNDLVFQFNIMLKDTHPPIWRRIQVKDCTLDKLHEHIQTAVGWTNSHLHHFKINNQWYGDPALLEETFEEMEYHDSTTTMLSDILPKSGKRFRLLYEYDFGDSWNHEVLFEGCPNTEAGRQYPLCLEGKGACPPEHVGGVWGFREFLEAIANSNHERHEEFSEWIGSEFDPETFDPAAATKAMKKGLPHWRSES
jgi:hypothetical protein